MGIGMCRSNSATNATSNPIDRNPNPENFTITSITEVSGHTIVMIEYPDCTNYQGKKLLLYKDVLPDAIKNLKSVDPHFLEGQKISPFARFEPTEEGKRAAVMMALILKQGLSLSNSG